MGGRLGPDGKRIASGWAWQRATAPYRAQCRRVGVVCWICRGRRGPLLYDGPTNHRLYFSVDHVIKVEHAPELALDPANWRPAHRGCNSRRENTGRPRAARPRRPGRITTSEQW